MAHGKLKTGRFEHTNRLCLLNILSYRFPNQRLPACGCDASQRDRIRLLTDHTPFSVESFMNMVIKPPIEELFGMFFSALLCRIKANHSKSTLDAATLSMCAPTHTHTIQKAKPACKSISQMLILPPAKGARSYSSVMVISCLWIIEMKRL